MPLNSPCVNPDSYREHFYWTASNLRHVQKKIQLYRTKLTYFNTKQLSYYNGNVVELSHAFQLL